MKSGGIPGKIKRWLASFLILALLPWAGIARGAHSLSEGLTEAAWRGDAAEVKGLLRKGADLNAKDLGGETILMYAARAGNLALAKHLIGRGLDINAKDDRGNTLTMFAAEGGNLELVKYLVDKGLDVHAKGSDGQTVLMAAARGGHLKAVKFFIDKGLDVNAKLSNGETALILALERGGRRNPERLEIVRLLLEKGADVNATTSDYHITALNRAEDPGAAKLLLENGADVNAKGSSVLMGKVGAERIDMVKLLLANGADVNAKTNYGTTALVDAVDTGYADMVKLLVENGAEVNVKEENGMTALRRAEIRNDQEIIDILKQAGAMNGTTTKDQTTPIKPQAGSSPEQGSIPYYPSTPEGVVEAFVKEVMNDVPITVEEMRSSDDIFLVQEKYFIRLREGQDQKDSRFPTMCPTFVIATGYSIKRVSVGEEEAKVTVLYNCLGWIWETPVRECRLGPILTERLRELQKSRCWSPGDRSKFLNISNDTEEVTYALAKPVDKWRLIDEYVPYISVSSAIKVLEYKLKEAEREGASCPSEEQKRIMKQDIKTLEQHMADHRGDAG